MKRREVKASPSLRSFKTRGICRAQIARSRPPATAQDARYVVVADNPASASVITRSDTTSDAPAKRKTASNRPRSIPLNSRSRPPNAAATPVNPASAIDSSAISSKFAIELDNRSAKNRISRTHAEFAGTDSIKVHGSSPRGRSPLLLAIGTKLGRQKPATQGQLSGRWRGLSHDGRD